jgi:3-hydroxybutyryl-CoA dehydrogenase
MRIATVGPHNRVEELKQKVSSTHELIEVKNNQFEGYDLIFDLSFDEAPDRLSHYSSLTDIPVIVCAVNTTIEQAINASTTQVQCALYGINSLPTFINRGLAEMTSLKEDLKPQVEMIFEKMEWDIKWVESRVGLVTPRIICMIINEAYYTVQEGTATKEAIDVGMKLGTAYPKGPFEWADQIGIESVYNMLDSIYADTRDERYKICPLLKKEYLQQQMALND